MLRCMRNRLSSGQKLSANIVFFSDEWLCKTGISTAKVTDVGVQKIPLQFMNFCLCDCMQSHRAHGF